MDKSQRCGACVAHLLERAGLWFQLLWRFGQRRRDEARFGNEACGGEIESVDDGHPPKQRSYSAHCSEAPKVPLQPGIVHVRLVQQCAWCKHLFSEANELGILYLDPRVRSQRNSQRQCESQDPHRRGWCQSGEQQPERDLCWRE